MKKRDIFYLFCCGMLLLRERDVNAARELVSALDDGDECMREMAGYFLHQASVAFAGAV